MTSILRVTTLHISTAHTDIMWQSIDSSMWTVIESNLGIIVACMPALRRPIAMFFPMLLGKMGRSAAHDSKRYPNRHPTQASAGLQLEQPKKKLHSRGTSSSLNHSWLHQDKLDNAAVDIHDGEETSNVSDGYRGSDDHILMDRQDYGRRHGGNEITKTTEVHIEPTAARVGRDPRYYPG